MKGVILVTWIRGIQIIFVFFIIQNLKEKYNFDWDYMYTAVIRAKSNVVIVSQKQAIFIAVNRTETDKWNTQLGLSI